MEKYDFLNKIEYVESPSISKDFFALQLDFAKELYKQAKEKSSDLKFLEVLKSTAPHIRKYVFEYNESKNDFGNHFKSGITEGNLLDIAYEAYSLENKQEKKGLSEKDGPNQKFGPLFYLTAEDESSGESRGVDNISFHFSNDYDMDPKKLLNIEERKKDIHNLLQDIKVNHPDTKTLSTASWLLDALPESVIKKLFPESFIDSIRVKETKTGWSLGTMIWGQFLDARGNLKEDLAQELMKNVKNMKEGEYLINLLKPPLYKPKSGIAPIEDFYKMYSV